MHIHKVIKRDGTITHFNSKKIKKAIWAAFVSVDGEETEEAKRIAHLISTYIFNVFKNSHKDMTVEEIQDIVEEKLMATNRKDVAKAYILYRNERNIAREKNSKVRKLVKEKLMATNVQNQNANVDEHSFGGRMGEANEVQTKEIALQEIISPKARNNHLNNRIYIHDLGSYAVGNHNCLSIPFDKLLEKGFTTRQTDVRPAQSVGSAFQLLAVIFQLQSLQQFGGVSATHLDWTLVPYVRKSFTKHFIDGLIFVENKSDAEIKKIFERVQRNFSRNIIHFSDKVIERLYPKAFKYALSMTNREVYQAVEAFYHNLNTLQSRSGNQLKVWLAS